MVLTEKTGKISIGNVDYFLIPYALKTDSSFPFDLKNDKLKMEIKKDKVVISRLEEEKNE